MAEQEKKGNWKGAGRKPRFSEPTKIVSFRVPESKVQALKALVLVKLKEWEG